MASRVFNALNGQELKDLILSEIRKQLDADPRFESHLTYPVVEWESVTKIDAYPVADAHMEIETKGSVGTEEAVEKARKKQTAEKIVVKSARKIGPEGQAPDEARAEVGLPVMVPTPTKDGVTFDAMEAPQRKT